jgi:hypothetical protein
MGNGRLYSTIGSYLVSTQFLLAPIAASKIGPLNAKLLKFKFLRKGWSAL